MTENRTEKELSEMTLEELWELFPIVLREHRAAYAEWYEEEKERICLSLGEGIVVRVSHIGSTAVPGLLAKPTVDILLEMKRGCDMAEVDRVLCREGYLLMNSGECPQLKRVYNKGYTKQGFAEKVFHLHVRYSGDWDELYFRDYLREHADTATRYGELKRTLYARHAHDRDAYTEGKTDFVREYTQKARALYQGRYLPASENGNGGKT